MILSDLHVHTTYCDGKSSIEETVQKAISKKMLSIGFSSHSYTPHDTSYCMKYADTEKYLCEIKSAAEKYKNKIEVYAGLERDCFFEPDGLKYDYIIGSAHYILKDGVYLAVDESAEITDENIKKYYGGCAMSYVKDYYKTVITTASKTNPDIIGHFDLVTKFNESCKRFDENSKEYKSTAFDALKCVSKKCEIIEMNTGAISRGFRQMPYPAGFLLKSIKELGMHIILSSDSHSADTLCFYFDECIKILKQNGINSVVMLKNGEFTEAGI